MWFEFRYTIEYKNMKKVTAIIKKAMEDHSLMIQLIQLILILVLLVLCVTN